MKAVVMAGGEGSRLRPLTVGRAKPMVPIVNKSALAHILDLLKSHDINEVVITLRYMASTIQDFFGDGSSLGIKIDYSVEESPLGTAGSVKNAAQYLDDTVLVISGDALTDFDLGAIVRSHKERKAMTSVITYRVEEPLDYGVVIADDDGRIVRFLEKPSWSEVISDTVNTGIYVLEPEVLDLIPDGQACDFSQELFPLMLERGLPLYAHTAHGYWCDVGNIQEYLRANADLLHGKVQLAQPIGTHVGGSVWVGQGVEIAPSAQLYGPIYLGNEVRIKGDVVIHGPAVIRDYSVIDNFSRIERVVIWRNTYVGESCELRGSILGRQCSVKSMVNVYEGAVIGDQCVLDEGCIIYSNVKLWPRKRVEPGALVKESIIWGSQGRRALFTQFGVTGLVNVDLTPEFAAKLGAALGATLPKGSYVAINRDGHRSSRMLKRAMISGLPSAGINVLDLGGVAIPVARHFTCSHPDTVAGIHVRLSPFDQRVVDIRFMDGQGMNQGKNTERTIEGVFFREDFRRAYLDDVGLIEYARNQIEDYTHAFLAKVDVRQIQDTRFKLVVDYAHGLAADTLSDILTRLDVEVVPLNARMDESKISVQPDEFRANLRQMANIVKAVNADLGVTIDVGGEKIFLVDELGNILDDGTAAALMLELALYRHPQRSVAIPIQLPSLFETIAEWHKAQIIRTKSDLHSLMLTSMAEKVLLAMDGTGNFIFPDFQPVVDGMMATVCLLEYLANRKMTVSQVVGYLPIAHQAQDRVNSPWASKGTVMRLLSRRYRDAHVDTVDGIKIYLSDGERVHIAPGSADPFFYIRAEAESDERATALVAEYSALVRELLQDVNQD